MNDAERALRETVDGLPAGLRGHVLRVVDEARRLARRHGVDEERAALAALGHDILRDRAPSELLALAASMGVQPDPVEQAAPILLHGPLAARLMSERYGVADPDVLAAAAWHTTARAGMSPVEKVLFLADKVEPGKSRRSRARMAVRVLAEDDLNAALLTWLDRGLARSLRRRWALHPATVAARNELLLAGVAAPSLRRGDVLVPR